MRVVFLDFDGVLNSTRSVIAYMNYDSLDPVAVGLVYQLCHAANAKIVVSSSWRYEYSVEEFNDLFEQFFGWEGEPVIDITPKDLGIGEYGHRGIEIRSYLKDHPEITRYVILDDDAIDVDGFDTFIPVNREYGMCKEHLKRALEHFGIELKVEALSKRYPHWPEKEGFQGRPPNRTPFEVANCDLED